MSLTITVAQRDALYDQLLDRLSGIGDIEVAIRAENYEHAERIGREFSDDLRLLLDDLGLGDAKDDPIEVTAPAEMLLRILPRLRDRAISYTASLEPEWAEVEEIKRRNHVVAETCEALLAGLGHSPSAGR